MNSHQKTWKWQKLKRYKIIWTKKAKKEMEAPDKTTQEHIRKGIKQLLDYYRGKTNKHPDVKQLKGKYRGLLRLRIGDYRVIFNVVERKLAILILRVSSRGDAYKN